MFQGKDVPLSLKFRMEFVTLLSFVPTFVQISFACTLKKGLVICVFFYILCKVNKMSTQVVLSYTDVFS